MGFLDRIRGRTDGTDGVDPAAVPDVPGPGAPGSSGLGGAAGSGDDGVEPLEEIGVRALSPEEQARLDTVRRQYAARGIDPADLATVATAYDRALDRRDAEDASAVIEVLSTAIGDHLVALGGYRWVVSTDPFGTDLAVEPPRRGVPVVTRTLVAVRWMARDRDWVTGVIEHLARIGRS
jgi:hypothetical protein